MQEIFSHTAKHTYNILKILSWLWERHLVLCNLHIK